MKMSELTSQQVLSMAETIANACGWGKSKDSDGYSVIYRALKGKKDRVWSGDYLVEDLTFEPQDNWNDFFIACDAMGVDSINICRAGDGENDWWVSIWSEKRHVSGEDNIDEDDPDKQTAAFLALYEFAKWKLEASK